MKERIERQRGGLELEAKETLPKCTKEKREKDKTGEGMDMKS